MGVAVAALSLSKVEYSRAGVFGPPGMFCAAGGLGWNGWNWVGARGYTRRSRILALAKSITVTTMTIMATTVPALWYCNMPK